MSHKEKIIRIKEVQQLVGGYSRSSIWRLEKAGKFPKRKQLGPRAVGWNENEIINWIKSLEEVQ